MKPILVTGAAGFIGYHVAHRLLRDGHDVVGVDNLNDYYDVSLKSARLDRLVPDERFAFHRIDLADRGLMRSLFDRYGFGQVVHLGAQAGVRHSLHDPHAYVRSNVEGFLNILEGCRSGGVEHLVYASSSSVYGANTRSPFAVEHGADHPLSVYAASKKSNELFAHAYSHLFDIPCTGLRFFTVYGPWGRPDMALFLFTRAILAGEPISVFNHGRMQRDFTYVDDVVEAVIRLMDVPAAGNPAWSGHDPDPGSSRSPYRIYNVGNHEPVALTRVIELLEQALRRKALIDLLPMQPGDVPATYAGIRGLQERIAFNPSTPIEEGVARFVDWYRSYYGEARDARRFVG